MFNKSYLSIQILAATVVSFNALADPLPVSDPGNSGGWSLLNSLSDEFNGNELDTTKWINLGPDNNYDGGWKGRAPSQYHPENVSVGGGFLTITSRWDDNFTFLNEIQGGVPYGVAAPITTAGLKSIAEFHYGYMETRAKAADGPISSSYWSTGPNGELDVFEHFGNNPTKPSSASRYHASFHDWRDGSESYGDRIWTTDHQLDYRVADGFHIYGFEWDPNYVAIYVDGSLVNCVTRESMGNAWVATHPQRAWIDSETFNWEVDPNTLTASDFGPNGQEFILDYTRVWQRNGTGVNCPDLSGHNLIENGSFEAGMTNWTGRGVNTNDAHHGNSAARLANSGVIEQVVEVEPNTTYMLSAWVRSPETNESNIWRNAYLGVRGHGGAQADTQFFFPYYHEKSLQFTTSATATTATVFFTNAPQGAQAIIDNVYLVKADFKFEGSPVTGVTLVENSISLLERSSTRASATVSPADAGNRGLTWSSSDETVAEVDGIGNIKAHRSGTSIISVVTAEGEFTDSLTVTVLPNDNILDNGNFENGSIAPWNSTGLIGLTDEAANVSSGNIACSVGPRASMEYPFAAEPNTLYRLTAQLKVDNAEAAPFYIGVKDHGDEGRGEIVDTAEFTPFEMIFETGPDAESATIFLWNSAEQNSNQIVYCDDIHVKKFEGTIDPDISVTGVTITEADIDLELGQTLQLNKLVTPTDANNQNVIWSSDAETIASVSTNGLVLAELAGTATITVTTVDGEFSDSITVTVIDTSTPIVPGNLLTNGDLESGDLTGWLSSYGNSQTSIDNQHSGTGAVYLNGIGAAVQDLALQPNTTYVLTGYGKVSAAGQDAYMGVKNYGDTEQSVTFRNTSYSRGELTFTTGANNTSARIYFWNGDAADEAYGDDFAVVEVEGQIDPEEPEPDNENCGENWIPVTGITLEAASASLTVNDTLTLTPTLLPTCTTSTKIAYGRSNKKVVSVNRHGVITARGVGTSTVTATSNGFTATMVITVTR